MDNIYTQLTLAKELTETLELVQRMAQCLEVEAEQRRELERKVTILTQCVLELKEDNVRLKNLINDKL